MIAVRVSYAGKVFGKLTAIEPAFRKNGRAYWRCRCACGRETVVMGTNLKTGNTQSCGCWMHGQSNTAEHDAWMAMIQRCEDGNCKSFQAYGERGIRVCERWRCSFENFIADMGPRPSSEHSIDRIDNDGNYERSNCRWATRTEQQRNRRGNKRITCNGVTKLLCEWAEETGLKSSRILHRLKRGWSPERAITTPARQYPKKRK